MKRISAAAIGLLLIVAVSACGIGSDGRNTNGNAGQKVSGGETMSKPSEARIKLTFNNEEVVVRMYDNPTSRDFLTLLPATIRVEDYAGTEKISYLPRTLSTQAAPAGSDPAAGDFTYYAPWGNLAIFYKDFGYSNGLVILGKIESGLENIAAVKDNTTIRIEKLN